GSTGLQAQFTTNVRQGLHATVNWDAAGVTGNALVTIGPTTLTLNKTDGQPLRVDVAGLSVVSPLPLGETPGQHQLMAASAPFAASSAGFAPWSPSCCWDSFSSCYSRRWGAACAGRRCDPRGSGSV